MAEFFRTLAEFFRTLVASPYFVNIFSNFVSLILLVLLGVIIQGLSQRRALLRFFRISRTKRVNLYLSNLRVNPFGALGVDNRPRSFGGTAIPLAESTFIVLFQRLFNYIVPGVEGQPGLLKWLLISDVEIVPFASPLKEEDIDASTTAITLGSPGYNVVSRWAEERLGAIAKFANDNSALSIRGLPPLTDLRQGFVQRVVSPDGTACFYLAGASEPATKGAAYFLVKRWQYLRKRFGDDKSFCIVVQIAEEDFRVGRIVVERTAI